MAPQKLLARVTRLEMASPPAQRVHAPIGMQLAIMRAVDMPLHFYRYLYEQVGKPHHWAIRRNAGDAELSAHIHSKTAPIEVLYVNGAPAGFFELDLAHLPEFAEILYFGLVPEFQGRGLSRFMLSCAVFAAWSHEPGKVVIETNSLDSPRALQLYQKMGFAAVSFFEEEIDAWE